MEIDLTKLNIRERFIYEKCNQGLRVSEIFHLMKSELPKDYMSVSGISQCIHRFGLRKSYKRKGRPKKEVVK